MRNRCRGFAIFDIIVGLTIIAILMAVMATAASWQARTQQRLADTNSALVAAEKTLVELHQGIAHQPVDDAIAVRVESTPAKENIPGFAWVHVNATCNGRTVSLAGLKKLDAGEKP